MSYRVRKEKCWLPEGEGFQRVMGYERSDGYGKRTRLNESQDTKGEA